MKVLSWLATVLLLIIAAIVIFALAYPRPGIDPEPSRPDSDQRADHLSGASGSDNVGLPSRWIGQSNTAVIPETLPASLSGTSAPSGWARVDSNGNLIPTPSLRQLFEYYLSALGEEPLRQLVARIEQELGRLVEPARSEALNILGNYLDYKLALGDLEASYGQGSVDSLGETERRMQEIQGLRRAWLDADTAEAFFAREEAVDRFQLEQRRIAGDNTLTEEQRAQARAAAEQALPGPLRRAREDTRRFAEYELARQNLADNPDALRAWREEAFGVKISQQLAEVEARQQAWEQRWQAYRQERQVLERAGLAEPEREAAIKDLRGRYFSGPDRVRARALDSLQ
ncbi:MAG: lipase [Marinobacter sp.]|nr:lipase [Marinobacter sp.]